MVVPRFEQALAEAAAADERQARGAELGPLHGVPITIKECFWLRGTPSTIGLDAPSHRHPASDNGVLVQRLQRAGAIILGKTNLPQLMILHESDNPVYGRTNNPWNLNRTPGGSTGGEAALIAARGSPLGLGNDLGGSIRIPCHWCGIHGFKPTSLRLPREGSVRTLRGFETIVTQPGPMARHVEDLRLALRVLADDSDGYVSGDAAPVPIGDPARVRLAGLKVAVWTDDGVFTPSPAIVRAVRAAAAALAQRGVEILELDAPQVERVFHAGEVLDLYFALLGADGGRDARRLAQGSRLDWRVRRLMWLAGLPGVVRSGLATALRSSGQVRLSRLVASAAARTADGYWQLVYRRSQLVAGVMHWLREQGVSALVCPPHALPAPEHLQAFDLLSAATYAFLPNFYSLPAGVVALARVGPEEEGRRPDSADKVLKQAQRAERGSAGLPVGVQVAALPWREDVALALMAALEDSFRQADDYPGRSVVPAAP